jgi:hypothetical protein
MNIYFLENKLSPLCKFEAEDELHFTIKCTKLQESRNKSGLFAANNKLGKHNKHNILIIFFIETFA